MYKMRIRVFLDIFLNEISLFSRRGGFDQPGHNKAFFDELKQLEKDYDARLDITLLTGCLVKPGDSNWETDGSDVRQILEDFNKSGLTGRVTSFIGINSITPPDNHSTTVETTSRFSNGKVLQLLTQFDTERDDILFYLYFADARSDGMHWNHSMAEELKESPFVYICSANRKIFGRGEMFDCQNPNAIHRNNEFEYQPVKATSGIASIVQGLKDVRGMKSYKTSQDAREKAINVAEDFFAAMEFIDEKVLEFLPADRISRIFSEMSKLQRRVFDHAMGISPPRGGRTEGQDKTNQTKELFI